jgi:hypothetical protein
MQSLAKGQLPPALACNPLARTSLKPPFDNDGKIYEIQLFFYEPQSDDHYINHIVARISGPFSHVEIAFPTYTTHVVRRSSTKLQSAMHSCALQNTWTLYGSSIFQSGVVFFQEKVIGSLAIGGA